ncbi:uncharacterized protein LOC143010738 isoform X2 [Genypterus blacodes]|uniref:uncharacterized protein LOC143010738 isoform X2 n=1 Tax=Genypterus blacodes TaxID=154954 RepID=UPI003F77435E
MKLTVFSLFWAFWGISSYSLSSTAGAKPVLSPPEKALTVYGVEGRNVTFPCSFCASLQTSHLVEWWLEDRSSQVTMFVLRDGRELVKDKAQEYVNRTTMQKDGALRLSKVKLQDNGTYGVSLKGREGLDQKAFFSLILVEASEVLLTIRPNSEGALELLCESRGWRLQPEISVLDDQRNALTAQTDKWTRERDGRYSVNATAIGNGTLICRVGIPDLNLWRESKISFTGDFCQSEMGSSWKCIALAWVLLGAAVTVTITAAVVAVVVAAVLLFLIPLQVVRGVVDKLIPDGFGGSFEDCLYSLIYRKDTPDTADTPDTPDTPDYTEYGDIAKITPSGASEDTARAHHAYEGLSGVEVSNQLAGRDLELMMEYKDVITTVGKQLKVRPALIAAIISKQSQAGAKLRRDGFGQADPNSYGLMQVNKNYHAVKGGAYSEEHVDHGVLILIQAFKTMQRLKTHWTKEKHLTGALAAYISGEERVIPLESHDVDSVTPFKDFSNDVIARAQWFAKKGF